MSEPGKVRIYLNRPALDRLLGGDTELEVRLREQVVDEFARKRLKALVNDETHRRIHNEFAALLKEEVRRQIGEFAADPSVYWRQNTPRLQADIQALVAEAAKRAVREAVEQYVADRVEKRYQALVDRIDAAVRERVDFEIQTRVEAEILRRLDLAKGSGR